MKIKIFIVRYKETDELMQCLESIGPRRENVSVHVINNFGRLVLPKTFVEQGIQVLQNEARPDFSTGHLARNWNQAIIHGFVNLNSPDCDTLICLQADAKLAPHWYEHVTNMPEYIWYLACGRGDEFQYLTPQGVRNVGLYDERFCNIGYQEGDYFLRNVIRIPDHCAILDKAHGRIWNPHGGLKEDQFLQSSFGKKESQEHTRSKEYHNVSKRWFNKKWNQQTPEHWGHWGHFREFPRPVIKEQMYYPYFEKDINPEVYQL